MKLKGAFKVLFADDFKGGVFGPFTIPFSTTSTCDVHLFAGEDVVTGATTVIKAAGAGRDARERGSPFDPRTGSMGGIHRDRVR